MTPLMSAAGNGHTDCVIALPRRKVQPFAFSDGIRSSSGLGITGTRLNAEMHLPRRRDKYLAVARSLWRHGTHSVEGRPHGKLGKGSDIRIELHHRWCALLLRGHGCPAVSHTAVACFKWCGIGLHTSIAWKLLTQRKDRGMRSLVTGRRMKCSVTGDGKACSSSNLDYHLGSTITYYVTTAKQLQPPKSSGMVGQMRPFWGVDD